MKDDVIYYASFEQPSERTKVYANEDLYLRWTADDRVSIFEKNTYNQEFRFTGETGDNAGGFKKVGGDGYYTGNDIPDVVSVYPYQEGTKITEDEVITLTLPAEQHYAENTFGLGANTMVSVSENNFLQYKNVGGYLRLSLYGEGVSVSAITLKGNNGEKLAGKASVTMPMDGTPAVVMADNATDQISLVCDTPVTLGSTAEEGVDFWFVVPPVIFSKGFTVSVSQANGGVFEKSTSKSITIERSNLSKMSPMEVEEIQPVINIVFVDDNIKAKLVAAFDTNGDGELSYDEAEAVSSLNSSVFGDDNDFTSFDEFRYFTGVTSIPVAFFSGWSCLKSITLPSSISSIGMAAFNECTSLASIIIPEGITLLPTAVFRECSSLSNVVLPNSLVAIGDAAFALCSSLETLTIPEGVQRIQNGAFGDSGLRSVSLPSSLIIIEGGVFQNCTNLTSVVIPESVTRIYSNAFHGCSNLESVYCLPETPPSIGDETFYDTNSCPIYVPAESVDAYKTAEYWSEYADRILAIGTPVAVDLGLPSGLKWASFNLGATKPEEYGDYYAWGETEPKENYDEYNYKWWIGDPPQLIKYCTKPDYGDNGFTDNKTVLDPEDDAAHVNLGGLWRMPTSAELTELMNNCAWEWTSINSINGQKVTGPNGNSLFLPAAGTRHYTRLLNANSSGSYWSSSLLTDAQYDPYEAWDVRFRSSSLLEMSWVARCYGHSIRPVCD